MSDNLEALKQRLAKKAAIDDYVKVHERRMFKAVSRILAALQNFPSPTVLEVGGKSFISELLKEFCPSATLKNTIGDLRYIQENLPDACIDYIVNCEVFEHIKDQELVVTDFSDEAKVEALTTFNLSGARTFLNECFRWLKPGGEMYFTTPNPASLTGIYYTLQGGPANIYRPHVREYSIYECTTMLRAAGFEIVSCTTDACWNTPVITNQNLCEQMMKILATFDKTSENFGEDIVIVAKKVK